MVKKKLEELQTPKGTHDLFDQDIRLFRKVEDAFKKIVMFYGFGEIETPIFEFAEIFERSAGESSDIVTKQMYALRTRGEKLVLRPEGTAPVARAYLQYGLMNWPQPVKFFYTGPLFRHEAPQRLRFRQFHTLGLETIGEENPVRDAEIILILFTFFKELGLKNVYVNVNSLGDEESRTQFRQALVQYYRPKIKGLCPDCKERLKKNPLRLLDCKKEKCIELRAQAPAMLDYLSEAAKTHFRLVLEFLDELQIPYMLDPHLVRGLDYYTRTVFEMFVDDKGTLYDKGKRQESNSPEAEKQESQAPLAISAGGRYDKLIELLGGNPTPAVGAGVGLERLVEYLKMSGFEMREKAKPRVFLIQLGDQGRKKALSLMEVFRENGITVAEALGKDSIKPQLRNADKLGCDLVIIMGQKEALDGTVILREMKSGNQEIILQKDIIEIVKARLKKSE